MGAKRVLIAGGGVAALEAMMALRDLAGDRVEIELIAPNPDFTYRPLAVAEPFGLGEARRFDLVEIAADHGARLHLAAVTAAEPDEHLVRTADGRTFDYDMLLLALGARPVVSIPGTVTLRGPGYTSRFRTVLRELEKRKIRRVAFAVPTGASWPLPLYELALMTAGRVEERGLRKVELLLVTPEEQPLELFGPEAAVAVRQLLEERNIELHTGLHARAFEGGRLELVPHDHIAVDRVVSLPRLVGRPIDGIPRDPDDFIPVDPHGLVTGETDVYAAGDATTVAIKQGGVAAQQADAAAQAIAARAGADVEPEPFRPVLRGLLLTGERPRFLRAEVSGGRGPSAASDQALWWPPSKVAGRYLAPYLARRHADLEVPGDGMEIDVGIDSGLFRRRAIIAPDASGRASAIDVAGPGSRGGG